MQRDEPIDARDEFGTCLACGVVIESSCERSYSFGSGNELCSACAVARGGAWVVDRDVWDPAPDLTGLRGVDVEGTGPLRRIERRERR